ncbi:DNA cytosine methyltransferase [Nocardia mexicana]|uniref:DNA (cytosine-5-)-methyltransferase n=1 Tax=Nocardia mexicana TaxID=279262 RepID=A0A370H2A3_9NOCA|nr:DNA cytosine methyltransferase [Nocardia mexicana]RDI49167.1 DNA (cytosine-5)-methyltransferase 1 [Nocardia mexicana]
MPAELSSANRQWIQMVDLFAGPGGLDVAAHWLGIDAHGIEWDNDAVATRDLAGLLTKPGDVRDFSPSTFFEEDNDSKTSNSRPDLTILAGGPPCQTYTVAGNGSGRKALHKVLDMVDHMIERKNVKDALDELHKQTGDERTGLVLEPLRWALEAIEEEMPYDAIVLEQVPAVLPVWAKVRHALEKVGYGCDHGILRTEEYGVPQTRRRAILIARRIIGTNKQSKVKLPTATHHRYIKGAEPNDSESELLHWKSMGETLDREHNFIVVSNYGTGGDPKVRGSRKWNEPSATVTGKISRNRVKHIVNKRDLPRFDSKEAGQLQTFPRDYPWSNRNTAQQIGNAIPPRLAVHVLAAALEMTFDPTDLENAVKGKWSETRSGTIPLLPRIDGIATEDFGQVAPQDDSYLPFD